MTRGKKTDNFEYPKNSQMLDSMDSKHRPSFLDRTSIYQYLNAPTSFLSRYHMASCGIPRVGNIPTKANKMKKKPNNEQNKPMSNNQKKQTTG
jgi:hypothetical protein